MAPNTILSLSATDLPVWIVVVGAAVAGIVLLVASVRHASKRTTASPPHLFILTFPPSRRHILSSFSQFEKFSVADQAEISPQVLQNRALTTTRKPDFSVDNFYTPTGFSTQEVRSLVGRFPDYASLSGVPHPSPVSPSWDIKRAIFRPFRPFRWNYTQNMALMKYNPDFWIELEQNYLPTMAARQQLFAKHPDRIFFQGPGADLACRELMEMLIQFLCRRYPCHFHLSNDNTLFHNLLLETVTDLTSTPPLKVIFQNIPEDYAIMLRNEEDGLYYLRAASVCSSVGWHIAQHKDQPMKKIHTHVPDADKMQFSLDRWFAKLPTDKPVMRASWSIEDWQAMFSSPGVGAFQGENEKKWSRSAFADRPAELTVKELKLRCDAQTLRRLPVSGAVVFNFKAIFTPLEELRDEPFVPALLHKVLSEGKENLIDYKSDRNVKNVALEALKGWADEQVKEGVVPGDWDVSTLEQSPFYPGWEEKWKRKQGIL
ncbi:uncharacterized protein PODANS_7_880 [Podospora anserina S mat+]|uniref:Podospora anserina S mat+ genomic DNA chromosome 7, supercontig 3 n=1 Tax=Podospora anserina (strain S / ATCC MYA-4624 / DSM 980 / FGSC 10383) TaxID=515849 RepID=B2AP01_PODAN|nr:uncharacterized protein PODANS_7_880 [Podospora anserina S mat+]CAP65706.1 unnamed protein product [Podospora anserina S mat+]CDP32766.1 Putative protein of unknown function [Podospora anserina S mat+]